MLQFSFLLHSLSSPALKSASNGLVSHSFSASYLLGSTIRQTTQSFLQSWAPVIFSMSPRQKGSLEIKILIKWPALPFFLRILSPGLNSHRQHNLPNVTELGTRNFFYVPTSNGIVGVRMNLIIRNFRYLITHASSPIPRFIYRCNIYPC